MMKMKSKSSTPDEIYTRLGKLYRMSDIVDQLDVGIQLLYSWQQSWANTFDNTNAHCSTFNQLHSLASFYQRFLCSYYSSSLNSISPYFFFLSQCVSSNVSSSKSTVELLTDDCPLPRNYASKYWKLSKPPFLPRRRMALRHVLKY